MNLFDHFLVVIIFVFLYFYFIKLDLQTLNLVSLNCYWAKITHQCYSYAAVSFLEISWLLLLGLFFGGLCIQFHLCSNHTIYSAPCFYPEGFFQAKIVIYYNLACLWNLSIELLWQKESGLLSWNCGISQYRMSIVLCLLYMLSTQTSIYLICKMEVRRFEDVKVGKTVKSCHLCGSKLCPWRNLGLQKLNFLSEVAYQNQYDPHHPSAHWNLMGFSCMASRRQNLLVWSLKILIHGVHSIHKYCRVWYRCVWSQLNEFARGVLSFECLFVALFWMKTHSGSNYLAANQVRDLVFPLLLRVHH